MRIYICRKGIYKISKKIKNIIKNEEENFYSKIFLVKNNIQNNFNFYYHDVKDKLDTLFNKQKVIGFGAAAKATTLINIFKLNANNINFIIDDTPFKQECFVADQI